MKPQSSQRATLCSQKEYLLMQTTEALYPVYSIAGYRYCVFLKSLAQREKTDKFYWSKNGKRRKKNIN